MVTGAAGAKGKAIGVEFSIDQSGSKFRLTADNLIV
jgi:hypothetical protein